MHQQNIRTKDLRIFVAFDVTDVCPARGSDKRDIFFRFYVSGERNFKDAESLSDLLKKYFRLDYLRSDESWDCEHRHLSQVVRPQYSQLPNCMPIMTRRHLQYMVMLPETLFIALNRFVFETVMQNGRMEPVSRKVSTKIIPNTTEYAFLVVPLHLRLLMAVHRVIHIPYRANDEGDIVNVAFHLIAYGVCCFVAHVSHGAHEHLGF